MSHNEYSQQKFHDDLLYRRSDCLCGNNHKKGWLDKIGGDMICEDCDIGGINQMITEEDLPKDIFIPLTCFKCEKKYIGVEGNCCCGACCSYCNEDEDVLIDGPIYSKYQDDYITDKFGAEYDWTFEKESWATVFHKVIFSDGKETTNGVWVGLREEEDEDVCCVGCGDRICGFHEEPDHKDDMDEAVCNDCY